MGFMHYFGCHALSNRTYLDLPLILIHLKAQCVILRRQSEIKICLAENQDALSDHLNH